MTETQVRIRVTTSGQDKLNRLGQTAGKLEKTFKANEKELDRLQRQLRSTSRTADTFSTKTKAAFNERAFRGIRTGTTNLSRFEREARDATRAINQLSRASSNVRSVDASVSGGGGGAGGSAALNAAALATATSVGQSKNLQQILQLTKEIKAEKKEQFRIDTANAQILRDVGQGQSKVAEQQKRINDNAEKINALSKQRNILDGQRRANLTKIAKGQIKSAEAVKRAKVAAAQLGTEVSEIDRKIGNAKRSTAGLKRELEAAVQTAKGFPKQGFQAPNVPGRGQGAGFGGRGGARQINSTTAALGGVAKAALGAAAAYVTATSAAAAFTRAVDTATQVASAEQRIRALAEGYDDYSSVVATVERVQKKFNLSQLEATNSVAKLFGRLRPLGLTLGEIESVYNGFNTATALTGATAAESAGALLQLSQALGAGALRGEEFNSVAEQAPGVLAAIGKELDVPIGRLKTLAKDGKITSDVLIKSLQRVEREGADRLAEALNTPAQKIKTLQNRVEDLNTAFGKLILPAVLSFLDALSGKIQLLTDDINKTNRALAKVNQLLQQFKILSGESATAGEQVKNLFNTAADAAFNFVASLVPGIRALQLFLSLRDKLAGKEGPRKVKYPTAAEIQAQAAPLRDRLGIGDTPVSEQVDSLSSGTSQAADDAERLAEAYSDTKRELERTLALGELQNEFDKQLLQNKFDLEDKIREINETVAEGNRAELIALAQQASAQERLNILKEAFSDIGGDIGSELADKIPEVVDELTILEQVGNQIRDTLEAALVDTITAAIDGSKDLNQILSDTLKSIGKLLIQTGVRSISSGILGFSEGGIAPANKPSLVGERGPEIIAPLTNTAVLPFDDNANALANQVGNATANASADAFEAATATMGQSSAVMAGNAAMAESAAYMSSGNDTVKFETFSVGGMDVVSRAEAMEIGRQAAKNARAQVFSDLKNKPATRGRIGL